MLPFFPEASTHSTATLHGFRRFSLELFFYSSHSFGFSLPQILSRFFRFRTSELAMTVMKPRSRMISVRLSEEEYSALLHLCSLTGARSVSDLTRDAMRTVLRSVNRGVALGDSGLDEFRAGMRSLERKIEQLEAKISTMKADRSEPGG